MSSRKLATVLRSQSHLEYEAQVSQGETAPGIGSFLRIGDDMVGLIYDTQLLNPDSLLLSPQKEEVSEFAPDLHDQTSTILKILLVGDQSSQEFPSGCIAAGTGVFEMAGPEVADFHTGSSGELQMRYLLNLNNLAGRLNPGLLSKVCRQLRELLAPANVRILELIERDLRWRLMVGR